MIFFIVTAFISIDYEIRKNQYENCIKKINEIIKNNDIKNCEIIIVENNGNRKTYLEDLGCKFLYTNNNSLSNVNKGYKELQDVLDCIDEFKISDDDFIVKITGRYILDSDSEFMKELKNLEETKYDCIIKYGPYFKPVDYKMEDCITGLIGMRCKFVKKIEKPTLHECVEWKWGKVTYLIEDEKICKVKNLGINICPGNNEYFFV